MLILVAILIFSLYIFYFYTKTKRIAKYCEEFPGPEAHKLFGNIFNFTFSDPLVASNNIIEAHKKYGEIFRVALIRDYQLMISSPKLYDIILSNTTHFLAKHANYQFLRPWLAQGLVISSGQHWYNHRKIITPAFHFKILEQFVEVFDRQSRVLMKKLSERCDGTVVDIVNYVQVAALDIISETAMGTTLNAQNSNESEYANAIEEIKHLLAVRMNSFWKRFDILYAIFDRKSKKRFDECIRISHDFTNQVIIDRRKLLMKNQNQSAETKNEDHDEFDRIGQSKKMVFIDILLQATVDGKPLSNVEIIEEVDTFMFAGHDTTTSGISAVLYSLSRRKNVQDKVFKEIIDVMGTDKNAPITYRQLQSLKYMEAVIKESFRLYPTVPVIGRYIDQDIKLDDGRIIPEGINVHLDLHITFRDPKYFKDPMKFDPERFTSNNDDKLNPFVYVPFSAGSRNCIGQKYAVLDMKTVIAQTLRHYELLAKGEEPIFTFEIVTRSLNGVQMALAHRI